MDNLKTVHEAEKRMLEPREQKPAMLDWEGNEIYSGERYIDFQGEIVLDQKHAIEEYLMENWETLLEGTYTKGVAE